MADTDDPDTANLTPDELQDFENPVIEDEDFDVDSAPLDELALPSDLTDGGIDDDSGLLEHMLDDAEVDELQTSEA